MMLEQVAGGAVMLLFLADIFLTVLYARAGTGLLAPRWDRLVWAAMKGAARSFGNRQGQILSFAGPLILVLLIAFWTLGLTISAALIIQPELGHAIRPNSGGTPTDFVTALLVAGNSLSIVGGGDYSPHTAGTRIVFLLNSLIGASVLSFLLSYLVQVYSGLRERNALALTIDLMTGCKGSAADMLARLGPKGDFSNAVSELGNLVRPLAVTKEAHHFYPLLFYFRFNEPTYSVSRFCYILLDLVTLIDTSLDRQGNVALIRSSPVASLRQGTLLLLETLSRNFPTATDGGETNSARAREHYAAAVHTLQDAGIEARIDADDYVDQRCSWEPLIYRVAPELGYSIDEVEG